MNNQNIVKSQNMIYNNSLLSIINSISDDDCLKCDYEFYNNNLNEGDNYLLNIFKYSETVSNGDVHEYAVYCLLTGSESNKIVAMANIDITTGECRSYFPENNEKKLVIFNKILKHELINNKCYLSKNGGMNVTALVLCVILIDNNILIRLDNSTYKNIVKHINMYNNNNLAVVLDGHAVVMFKHNNQLYIFDSLAQQYDGKYVIDHNRYINSFDIDNYNGQKPIKLITKAGGIQQNSTCFLYCLSFLDLMTNDNQTIREKKQYILNNINNVFCNKEHNGELLVIENMLNMLCGKQDIINIKVEGDKINKVREIENNNNSIIKLKNSHYILKINNIINESTIKFLNKNVRDKSINVIKPAKEIRNDTKYMYERSSKVLNRTDGIKGHLILTRTRRQILQKDAWRYGIHKKRFNILHKKQYHTKKQYNLRLQRWRQRENLKYNQGKYVLYR